MMNTEILTKILDAKPPKGSTCHLTSDFDTLKAATRVMDMANAVPGMTGHLVPRFVDGQLKYATRLLLHDNYDKDSFQAFMEAFGDIEIKDCPDNLPLAKPASDRWGRLR